MVSKCVQKRSTFNLGKALDDYGFAPGQVFLMDFLQLTALYEYMDEVLLILRLHFDRTPN
jgi:hypothetical protein